MRKVIGLGTAGATYMFLQNFMKDDLYSPLGPVFFAGVMAYYVASSFAALLGMVRVLQRVKHVEGEMGASKWEWKGLRNLLLPILFMCLRGVEGSRIPQQLSLPKHRFHIPKAKFLSLHWLWGERLFGVLIIVWRLHRVFSHRTTCLGNC